MGGLKRESLFEALLGLLVVLVAIGFVLFAWQRTGGGGKSNAVEVTALFPNAAGVAVGTDVRVAGLKVGTVRDLGVDPQSFQVKAMLAIDPEIKLPKDSSAAITSEGLLGSNFIAMIPGGDPTPLKAGDTIVDTQGSIDLMSLIGQFINKGGSSSSDSSGSGSGASGGSAPKP